MYLIDGSTTHDYKTIEHINLFNHSKKSLINFYLILIRKIFILKNVLFVVYVIGVMSVIKFGKEIII